MCTILPDNFYCRVKCWQVAYDKICLKIPSSGWLLIGLRSDFGIDVGWCSKSSGNNARTASGDAWLRRVERVKPWQTGRKGSVIDTRSVIASKCALGEKKERKNCAGGVFWFPNIYVNFPSKLLQAKTHCQAPEWKGNKSSVIDTRSVITSLCNLRVLSSTYKFRGLNGYYALTFRTCIAGSVSSIVTSQRKAGI